MSFSLAGDFLHMALPSAIFVWLAITALWRLSIRLNDASIADIWWGPGFFLLFLVAIWAREIDHPRVWLLLSLVGLWSTRMGAYFAWRNIGHGEDRRYQAMRSTRPHFRYSSYVIVFLFQGFLQLFVSLPIFGVLLSRAPLGWLDGVGALVLGAGILIEGIADWQLARFKARPDSAGKVMDGGLWAWCRHPNYFGNCVIWLGIGLFGTAAGAPIWIWLGPIVMWFLLVKVSGVAMLEDTIVDRRPQYANYIATVPALIPRIPRRKS